MLVIGLTGGIGCGKTTVSQQFAALGAPIIDADTIARAALHTQSAAYPAIVALFGSEILDPNQDINRAQLRQQVSTHPDKLDLLEHIIHPLVRGQIEKELAHLKGPYVIVSVPLLLEKNYRDIVHRVLVVDCPETVQLARVQQRNLMPPALFANIMKRQLSRAQRLQQADDIIDNSGDLLHLHHQVLTLHQRYLTSTVGAR